MRDLTPEEIEDFRERAAKVNWNGSARYVHPDGKARRRLPVPWRTRARLRARRTVDGIGSWLCAHGCEDAALRLWRALGMVRG